MGKHRLRLLIMVVFSTLSQQCERIFIDDRYCYSISCSDGEEPVPCHENDERSATCQPCPPDTYSDGRTRLGERCSIKTFCVDDHMTVEDEGSPTTDRVCGCEDGYRLSYYVHKCYPIAKTTTTASHSMSHKPQTSTHRITAVEGEDALPASSIAYLSIKGLILCWLALVCVFLNY